MTSTNKEQKKSWYEKISSILPNLYYIGTLISLIIILAQVFYAKRSIVESSEWEKAKMTIENIERFKVEISKCPIGDDNVWIFGDQFHPDFSKAEGWNSPRADSLLIIFVSLYKEEETKASQKISQEVQHEIERMIDVMDAFAYPIIMGYASEVGSSKSVLRQYYTYGSFIMPIAFSNYKHIGLYAKLLYRLWRIRYEQEVLSVMLLNIDGYGINGLISEKDNLLFFDENEITESSLRRYIKTLDKEINKVKEEIDDFRKQNND
ncbi:hypothetical protein [Dysgonomonas massiliensis]|uniref:hypothetical protein n=1 Tax=Dysgonomonas massiliensis TaxID=2040292 RepID=UPI000C78BA56|nr:hypothetical protein [Dysgonomonas massiliensis]